MKRKILKKQFKGNFLFSGFPNNIYDCQQWAKTFGWEAPVEGYILMENE
jgi:hypothetical protein